MKTRLSRRSVLKGLGAFAATVPFFRALEASAGGTTPLRFVGMYHPHGASSPLFTMQAGESETAFDIAYSGCVLSPFDDAANFGASYKNKLLILEGIDLTAAIEGGQAGHAAPSCILTGSYGQPANPSIDQYLAVDRNLGADTPITSMVLGVGIDAVDSGNCISFGAGGASLSKVIDPVQTFTTLFGGLTMGGGSGTDPAAQAKVLQQWKAGKSVLDYLNADLNRLNARLAGPEKAKLDQHASALRDIEKRLGAMPDPDGGTPTGACTPPGKPQTFPSLRSYNNGEPYFEQITNLQVDLLAQAMACDLTRFGTLWLNDLSRGADAMTGLTGIPADCHADLAHRYVGPHDSNYGSGASTGDPATWAALGAQNKYSYSKAARFLQRANEFGFLDQLGLYMSSDMGDPNAHSSRDVPMILAGGWGGYFRMGRRIKVANDCPPDRYYCDPPSLISNAQILVSIAQAFGQSDVTMYGNGSGNMGELPNLR